MVLVGHLLSKYGYMETYKLPKIQNFGVLIFFVLSGFLITQTTLIKGETYNLKSFLIDRFSRIYSAFFPALFFILIIDFCLHSEWFTYNQVYDFSVKSFIGNLFMFQSHPVFKDSISSFGSARPFWTVSIEWFFYVFFGLLFFFNLKEKSILKKILYCFVFILSGHVVFYYLGGRGGGLTYYWFFGFLLAMAYNNEFKISHKLLGTFIASGVLCLIYIRYSMLNSTVFYDLGIGFLFSLFILVLMKSDNFLGSMTLNKNISSFSVFLASFSYSLYLIHFTLIDFFQQAFKIKFQFAEMILLFVLINILSYLFYLCFEKHHLKLRKRLKGILIK
jgi:peptidoglycan/LPS O-acetylase OafA/YrhL